MRRPLSQDKEVTRISAASNDIFQDSLPYLKSLAPVEFGFSLDLIKKILVTGLLMDIN
jgi:hypothetical protein